LSAVRATTGDAAEPTLGYERESLRQDGRDGALWSPLWRLRIALTPVERALLKSWPLRRLHFLHHNGASSFVYPLQASRLQHTLGVLALVAHFRPDDIALRAAALLHDVGHYPFCHSAELVSGVDHHAMTRRRVTEGPICDILWDHKLNPEQMLALMEGEPPNPLRTRNGLLHLDHLDSWARQAEAAGYAEMPAHALLTGLHLEGVNVAAGRSTAEYLARLIRLGNERHYAPGDIGPATVLARAVTLAQARGLIGPGELAEATDGTLLSHLEVCADRKINDLIALLKGEPWRIRVQKLPPSAQPPSERAGANVLTVDLNALYDAVPLEAGNRQPITEVSDVASAEMARIRTLPGTYIVSWT
jgi:hypothetical protein